MYPIDLYQYSRARVDDFQKDHRAALALDKGHSLRTGTAHFGASTLDTLAVRLRDRLRPNTGPRTPAQTFPQ
jgi:hypothetical protein